MKTFTFRFLVPFLCFMPMLLRSQRVMVTWNASVSRDWNVAANWTPSGVPTADKDVVIGYTSEVNSPIIKVGTAAVANSVQVELGARLTIESGASLAIDGGRPSPSPSASFVNLGIVENSGVIRIDPSSSSVSYGIYTQDADAFPGKFTNKSGGEIYIDGTTSAGFDAYGALFVNEGKVFIGSNKTVGTYGLLNTNAVENKNGGEIYLYKFSTTGLNTDSFSNFTNAGKIVIDADNLTNSTGIDNDGSMTNQSGGEIYIDGVARFAFSHKKGTFTNAGKLVIGANDLTGIRAFSNSADAVVNNTGGEIYIDRFTSGGIGLENFGSFTNAGKVVVGSNSSTSGGIGISNQSSFLNQSGGTIAIDRTLNSGLSNGKGTFTNEGSITIGANALVGFYAILNSATFNDNAGGKIFLDQSSRAGLMNGSSGNFTNEGNLVIGANGNVGVDGVQNDATFANKPCGELRVMRGKLGNLANKTLTNTGLVYVVNELDNQGTFTNNGVLRYGTLSGSVTNTSASSVIVNSYPTTPIFSFGGSYNGSINIYSDEAATQSAGTFSLPNNFTPLTSFPTGTRTLYAKITNGGCNFVVPFNYLVCNITLVAGSITNPTTCGGNQGSIAFTTTNLPNGTNYALSFTTTSTTTSPKSVNVAGNNFTLSGLTAGTYSNFMLTALGCTIPLTTSKELTDPPLPTVTIVGNNSPICSGKDAIFTVKGTSGATLTYIITGLEEDQTLLLNGNNQQLTLPNAVADVNLIPIGIAKDNCTVFIVDNSTVTVNPLPTATISGGTAVCKNASSPKITFTGAVGTAPYTLTYKINNGSEQSITTTNGSSVSLDVPTNESGTFEYILLSVKDGSSTACSQTQSGSATVTVNALPTATISGMTTVCRNSTSPKITFTGDKGTAPYTFTYKLNTGSEQTVTTQNGSSVSLDVPTDAVGEFVYTLISVKDATTTACSQTQSGSATVTVNPLPTVTITGTTALCQNSQSPNVTFTGSNATAPYTFTYKINDGTPQTVKTTSGNSVTVSVPTGTAGEFVYSLVSVLESSSTACSQTQSGSATVTVNALPTATISGMTTVCRNSTSPKITFTGDKGAAPYTFTYKLNTGAEQTVTTQNGSSVSLDVPTDAVGEFVYTLISVKDATTTACSQTQSGSATVTVNPLPTATITGTTALCQNSQSPNVTFTGSNATAPYTFTYKINDGTPQTVKTTSGNSVTVSVPTGTAGEFVYSLVSVLESSSTACSQTQSGSATVTVNALPTATISGTTTVCQNVQSPSVTFTGSNATAPYTFTYKINDGSPQTVKTTSGNSVTVSVPTGTAGVFVYSLVNVSESSSTTCNQTQSGSATVTVNPLPTATITGTTALCQNSQSPNVTFTGSNATAPYTFTYKINDGTPQTVKTTSGNSATVSVPTSTAGEFVYSLVSVSESSSTACSQTQSGSATVTVNPLPTATISGTTTVCQNVQSPSVTFTGSNATAPYTFTYKINDGSPQTVKTTSGNSVTVSVPTGTAGVFVYSLVNVSESSSTTCNQTQSGSATVTVNPLPTATITGTTALCQNSQSPNVTFTGSNATAPYTFTYKINDGTPQTVKTTSGNSATVSVSTGTAGEFVYSLVSVSESSSTTCSQIQSGSATVTVNPLPTATISGTTTVCQNGASPSVTFTGANATAPYTFTYKINDGAAQTVKTVSGNSVAVAIPTDVFGVFKYSLVSVSESSSTSCSQAQGGSVEIKIQSKPTITLATLQQTLNEGNSQTLCDIDANPVNNLQFTVTTGCVVGAPVWRVQVGNGAWSDWSTNPPVSQPSNNQLHRYQAACDASCPSTYTSAIEVKINYRASTPQQVSLIADGITVIEGESKDICNVEGNALTFSATCASGEVVIYSVDGGDYSSIVPLQLVDGQFHNYRVRCRKSDGTLSCIETESGVMRIRINSVGQAPVASLNVTNGCGTPVAFSGTASCGSLAIVWYNASTNAALLAFPSQTPNETTSYYARCQAGGGCLSEKSNTVTYTVIPVNVTPVVSVSAEVVCTGVEVTVSTTCPAGAKAVWNTGVEGPSFTIGYSNVTRQRFTAFCKYENGCQSGISAAKEVSWKAFELTLINIGESKSAIKSNDRAAWSSQFITRDGGPELEQSTQQNPTLYYVENANKLAPRYWTINVDACALGTNGSLTFDMLATPEMGVLRSFNTHENNAPYFMYANRDGWTELYAQNHPAYGFYQDNGVGGNVYDSGLPKGLYKLGIRYWDMKGWGSIYPSTRKPQGNVLAYQEYWFRIQSKDGVGVGAARAAESGEQVAKGEGQVVSDNGQLITDNSAIATVLPNPVSNVLRLKLQESKGLVVQTSLTDASGRAILHRQFVPETNTHQEDFGVSELPKGMYFLQVKSERTQSTLKIIKL
ncbi:hypothetical protein FHS57_005371 [Runella defluvii]|uniref:Secretion system C-terminal sorting domain-containing protein n=1 Tax=Runella defluvii TaxID=370973 RepID=A0A7W5ZQN9_9BACT|nr:T9SS type A sorting domain-containing protein [Runella defluvii]MBB3841343.1 hypothetical protein [Runella defluvii]